MIELPPNETAILERLRHRQIAISDTNLSCMRRFYSSLDKDLKARNYNKDGLQTLIQNGVRKILCTSKGVLADLERKIICHRANPFGIIVYKFSER